MPVSTQPASFQRKSDFAVVAHLSQPDSWTELKSYVDAHASGDDVIITCPLPITASISAQLNGSNALYIQTSESGRDAAPFLQVLPILAEKGYPFFLKVHSLDYLPGLFCSWKPSLRSEADWRRDHYQTLFGKRLFAQTAFEKLPRLGMIPADGHLISYQLFTDGNYPSLEELKTHFGLKRVPSEYVYPAGSMFFGRTDAFQTFIRHPFDPSKFEPTNLSSYHGYAHAFERIFGLTIPLSGYQVKEMGAIRLISTPRDNDLVSFITRFHDIKYLDYLEEAGQSISQQGLRHAEWVIVTKNFTPALTEQLREGLQHLGSASLNLRIENVICATGIDGRSKLLNKGLELAQGRFVSFLDYDDILESEYATALTDTLRYSTAAIAAGGCVQMLINATTRAPLRPLGYYTDGHRLSLFWNNFIPIHAFVVDRQKVPPELMYFDEELDRCEDYDFLIRISSRFEIDLSLLAYPLCVYRVRDDGSNTTLEGRQQVADRDRLAWNLAVARVQEKKKDLTVTMTARELSDFVAQIKSQMQPSQPMSAVQSLKHIARERLQNYPKTKFVAIQIYRLTRFVYLKLRALYHAFAVTSAHKG